MTLTCYQPFAVPVQQGWCERRRSSTRFQSILCAAEQHADRSSEQRDELVIALLLLLLSSHRRPKIFNRWQFFFSTSLELTKTDGFRNIQLTLACLICVVQSFFLYAYMSCVCVCVSARVCVCVCVCARACGMGGCYIFFLFFLFLVILVFLNLFFYGQVTGTLYGDLQGFRSLISPLYSSQTD